MQALVKHFDAADYFKSFSAESLRPLIAEMGGKAVSNKKGELVAVAIGLQKSVHWLPRELRPAGLEKSPKAGKAAAKPKAAKKAARRK